MPLDRRRNSKRLCEVLQFLALGGVDDADAIERNVQPLGRGFDFGTVAQQDRHAQPQRIELPRRLQYPRLGPFREHDPLRVPLQLLNDTANKTHNTVNTGGIAKGYLGFLGHLGSCASRIFPRLWS